MVFVRKVVRKKYLDECSYSLNFPREVIEKLDLIGATIKLTIKKDRLIITKIIDEPDNTPKKVETSKTKPEDKEIYI